MVCGAVRHIPDAPAPPADGWTRGFLPVMIPVSVHLFLPHCVQPCQKKKNPTCATIRLLLLPHPIYFEAIVKTDVMRSFTLMQMEKKQALMCLL